MSRWVELIEGTDGKLSSTKITTYLAVLTLCGVLITTAITGDPSSEIAAILAALSLGNFGFSRYADTKIAQAAQGPSPVVQATVQGDMNVKGQDANSN